MTNEKSYEIYIFIRSLLLLLLLFYYYFFSLFVCTVVGPPTMKTRDDGAANLRGNISSKITMITNDFIFECNSSLFYYYYYLFIVLVYSDGRPKRRARCNNNNNGYVYLRFDRFRFRCIVYDCNLFFILRIVFFASIPSTVYAKGRST